MNALKVAESTGEVLLNDRIVSLVTLVEIWRLRSNLVEKMLPNAADLICNILKKAARDIKRTLCVISIELIFRILMTFAGNRHPIAPFLYKLATFLLIEFYWEIDVREMMLRHFIDLF
jgi:hypothetical protein